MLVIFFLKKKKKKKKRKNSAECGLMEPTNGPLRRQKNEKTGRRTAQKSEKDGIRIAGRLC